MFSPNLTLRIKTILEEAGTGIDIVEGLRSDDLPAPCVVVHLESAEGYSVGLADVYRVVVSVRYEEHYADSSSALVKSKFNNLLDQFTVEDIVEKVGSTGYHVFDANVTNVQSDIQNDFFVNEFNLELIAERKV